MQEYNHLRELISPSEANSEMVKQLKAHQSTMAYLERKEEIRKKEM